tara:strand:- start:5 stop:394 length:390 start_codon:yes stop_codon:yes gene_type:complete
MIFATMPDVAFPGIDNGHSKNGGDDSEVTVLGHPVPLEGEIILARLVMYINHIAMLKVLMAYLRSWNHPGKCVQILVLPFRFVCVSFQAFGMACSFIKNEEEHLGLTVLVTKRKNYLLIPPAFVQNSSE